MEPTPRTTPDAWGAANRVYGATTGVPGPRDPTITAYMIPAARVVHAATHRRVVAVTAAQSGKALAIDTPIATPDGWKAMGDLQVGDCVFGSDGQPVVIDRVSPVMLDHSCYEVEFDDGQVIVADAEHIWTVERTDCSGRRRRVTDVTTEEMVRDGVCRAQSNGRNRFMFSVPVASALALPEADLPLDPYVLGAWLGDGNSRAAALTVGSADLEAMSRILHDAGVETAPLRDKSCWRVAISLPGKKHKRDGIRGILRSLGLLANKHVPPAYLRASAAQRLALLQGLMDTDGGVDNGTVAAFCAKDEGLARNVVELAASLGYRPRIVRHKAGHWVVHIQCYRETTVFRLERKTASLRSVSDAAARPFRNSRRSIVAIRPTASVPVKCIGVMAPDHLFLAGPTMIPTHNTDNIFDVVGARLDQRPAPILYVGPSRDFVTDQFEPRFETLLTEAPSLRAKLPSRRKGKKTLKRVAGVTVRMGWAGSSTSLKSDPFGLGIVDEYDEMLGNVKGQGDPLGLVEARGDTYADFVTLVVSTPSQGAVDVEVDPDNGLEFWAVADPDLVPSPIWRLWQQGTRHHFAWPCPDCGEFFVPRFKHLWWPKGSTPAQAMRDARLVCPCCGVHLEEGDDGEAKKAMIRAGVQIAPGQSIDDARAMVNEPDNPTWSCWTSGLCSPFVTWGERAARYLTALASGEPDKIQTVMNAAFGEVYSPIAATDQPEWAEIMDRRLPYRQGEVPSEALRVVMGVDVQKFSLLYAIRAYGARGTSWLIENGQLYGPTEADDVWDALADRMLTPVGGLQIERVGIDSGFRPDKADAGSEHKVYEFCRRYSWLCVPTKGKNVQSPPYRTSKIEVKADGKRALYSIELAWLSSDFFKSMVFSKIRAPMGVPGGFYVHNDVTEDYCRQVASEVRTIKAGAPVWVRRSRDNHYLDCEAICEAMAYTLNVQRIPEGTRRAPDDDVIEVANRPDPQSQPTSALAASASRRARFAGIGQRLR